MYSRLTSLLAFAFLIVIFAVTAPVLAEITASPNGFTVAADEGDEPEEVLVLTNRGDENVSFSIRMSGQDWDGDERRDGPRRDRRGGPDDMEYEFRDDLEDDGPIYQWIDITEFEDVMEVENLQDDSFHGMYELGFEFPYYGNVYDEIGMHTNGFACFIDASPIVFFWPQWEELPNANPGAADRTPPPTLLAVNYQDLNPTVNGEIFYWTNERDMAIIQWQEVAHFANANGQDPFWTFQVILRANGLIKYQYAEIGQFDQPQDLIIGLQNEDRDLGFTVAFDRDVDYYEEGRAIAFGPPGAWVPWLQLDPESGEIQPDESAEIDLIFELDEDMEPDIYWANLLIALDNDQETIVVPVLLSYRTPFGRIEGVVTDAANDEPVEGAILTIEPPGITVSTNEEGQYEILDLPPHEYQLTCFHPDYLPFDFGGIEVIEGEAADGSLALLHAEFNYDGGRLEAELNAGESREMQFTVTNDGNAPCEYSLERRLIGEANAEPWEMRNAYYCGQAVEDDRLGGVVFANDHYYVSGSHDGEPAIYIFDRDGEPTGDFPQPGDDDRGMKDLAWDGELLWGAISDVVYGFNFQGEAQVEFEAPMRPVQGVAWDSDREMLWVCGITTDITLVDQDGNVEVELDRGNLRIYGLAYWPNDPDGFPLYVFHKDRDNRKQTVHKFNPDDPDADPIFVTYLEPEDGGSPGGAYITNRLDVYSWAFISVSSNSRNDGGDRVDVWQLDTRKEWFIVEPDEGIIEDGDEQEFTLTFDATGFPAAELEGELAFTHNGLGGATVIPVGLTVIDEGGLEERILALSSGWNMISVNVIAETDDVVELTQPLVDDDLLILMKDGDGRFYSPEFEFINIPRWEFSEGYQMKLTEGAELTIEGEVIPADEPIALERGWQIISYFPRDPVEATVAFAGIVEQLEIAKDGQGRFYIPEFEFSNMGDLVEGQGYQVKVGEDVELVWNVPDRLQGAGFRIQASGVGVPNTGRNMSLLVLTDENVQGVVEVYAGERLVGMGEIVDGAAGAAIWGDDATTDVADGALDKEALRVVLRDGDSVRNLTYSNVTGEASYTTDGLWVMEVECVAGVPTEFGIIAAYPNPFNSSLRLTYAVPEPGEVRLTVYDLTGRKAGTLASGRQESGVHQVTFDGNALGSGVYFVELKALGQMERWKVALVR